MEPRDVRECADIVAAHPVIGPRYGSQIGDLPKAWLRLLACEAKRTTVFYSAEQPRAPICFVGVSLFVNDDFMRELKAPPGFWMGPELAKRILSGNSPILSDKQFREANSRYGLNLIVWEGCIRSGFETNNEIQGHVMIAFIEEHSGFLLKELISSQIESTERLQWTIQTGAQVWNPAAGRYEKSFKQTPEEIVRKPHLVGVTRNMELERDEKWTTSWVGTLFDYHSPMCGFSPSEQRMLLMALGGGTDDELSEELDVSIPTVKKMWLSVYRRVDQNLPEVNPNHPQLEVDMTQRGKEKKRHLLIYLRKHPEELRPVSQKLLLKPSATNRPSSDRQSL
jgi:hypothetical protein